MNATTLDAQLELLGLELWRGDKRVLVSDLNPSCAQSLLLVNRPRAKMMIIRMHKPFWTYRELQTHILKTIASRA